MTASLSGEFNFEAFTDAGDPAALHRLYTYVAGTTTHKTAYQDAAASVPHSYTLDGLGGQYIALNARGELTSPLFLTSGGYDLALKTPAGATVWTRRAYGIDEGLAGLAVQDDPAKGAALVGLYDGLAPSFLKVTSDLLNHAEVSLLRFIDRAKHANIQAGANGDDLTSNLGSALSASANGVNLFIPRGLYNLDRATIGVDNTSIRGVRGTRLRQMTAGRYILAGAGRTGVTVQGVQFEGLGSSTVPLDSIGGYAAGNTGLLTLATCTDVRVDGCEFSSAYNLLSVINSSRAWLAGNRGRNWTLYGILASLCKDFDVIYNRLIGCDQTGAANAYGIAATGDEAGANIQRACNISWNVIRDVVSWDGIMTHDVSGLRVIGNDIRNVRSGLDISYTGAANEIRDLLAAYNTIEATTTDAWGGASAIHNAILVSGFSSTDRISNAQLIGNTAKKFYTMGGAPSFAGNAAHIALVHVDRVTCAMNTISEGGTVGSPAGILLGGTVNQAAVDTNSLQGSFPSGGIRGASVTSDILSIDGNIIKQTTITDIAVQFSGSTVTALRLGENPSNSQTPFSQSGSTLAIVGTSFLGYSGTWDPASVANGARTTTTVTVTGAAVGDYVDVSFSNPLQGLTLTGYVDSANTVVAVLANNTGGAIDLASGTLRARVHRA